MKKFLDLKNQRFGRLVARERCGSNSQRCALWICDCDCGNECIVSSHNLRTLHTQSCGCLQRENTSVANTTHGKRHSKLYGVWNSMIGRCKRESSSAYKDYGGRGISVCEDWMDFQIFYNWAIENGYREGLSIDRIDVNGNYCPENCRWTTKIVQANNKRNNEVIEYNGIQHTASEWSRILGIKHCTLRKRLREGWSIEKAFSTPIRGGDANDSR